MIPLFCICGLMKQFCCKCRPPEQNLRSHHQTPPEAPTTAPLEIWVPTLDPPPPYDQVTVKCDTMILFIVFLAMIPLFCICGQMKPFCCKCRQPDQNPRSHHQTPPEAPTTAPLEIWVPTLDPPPPYDQVVMKPVEPPPPYSLRPEDPAG
ncbi:Transmembrane protein 92 [Cricetulus griseus]|uniref:Transmembrane protein 92 n=1 Tax=Cricetulus griseus TaxID=10029 RepID=G3HJR5_CRIGR|nr:Transmembrane protein 92 [Cricetulus griseus]